MKQLISVILFLLFSCLCFAQKQRKLEWQLLERGANNDCAFFIDCSLSLEMQFPERNDIPNLFYVLSYDGKSRTAFIYNDYICGYYRVPRYSMRKKFKALVRNLQSENPKYYNNRVNSIKSSIAALWQEIDSAKKTQENRYYIENKRFDNDKWNSADKVFDVVERMPGFPWGMAGLMYYLKKSIKYPPEAEENGIQGRVICTFVILRDGCVTDVRVIKSVDPLLDREAVRIIKAMPKWIPGKQNGQPVNVKQSLPVTFRLQ